MDIKREDEMKYKIGEFSKLTLVPVKTLRYYDEIDLLKPAEVDLFTGYRYYTEKQKVTLEIILELKEAGFLLEEIKQHWNDWKDEDFIKQKEKVYQEQENLNRKIKKIDELRTRLKDGILYTTEVTDVLIKRRER